LVLFISEVILIHLMHLIIKPKPEQIIQMFNKGKLNILKTSFILEPYHYGLIASKK